MKLYGSADSVYVDWELCIDMWSNIRDVCYVQLSGGNKSADMDGSRASGDEQTGPNGLNVTQNPFDPAALLGTSRSVDSYAQIIDINRLKCDLCDVLNSLLKNV